MKPSLPIYIPSLPDTATSPALWRQIAPLLSAIAEREKRNADLYPSERIAYNAIALARYQANKKQWLHLWQYLLDRQIVQIKTIAVATPPPKPKTQRPTKPPKNRARVKRPRLRRGERHYRLTKFAALRPTSIRLLVFLWFADWIAYSVPLCPRPRKGYRLRYRPQGERIKALLAYNPLKVKFAYAEPYRMHPEVKKLLSDWSGSKRRCKGAKIESIRIATTEQLNAALTEKWTDISTIAYRLFDQGIDLSFYQVESLLNNRLAKGEVFRISSGLHDAALYSRVEATEIDCDRLSLDMAYKLAQSRGYRYLKNSFGNTSPMTLAGLGLEFKLRKDMGKRDNKLLGYRDLWKDGKTLPKLKGN